MPRLGTKAPGSRPDRAGLKPSGRKVEAELLPVDPPMLETLWRDIVRIAHWEGNEYDTNRLKSRALAGIDRVWLGAYTRCCRYDKFAGLIVTTVSDKPPTKTRPFKGVGRSLTVHIVSARDPGALMDSAVERLTLYGKEQSCKALFVMGRPHWRVYALRFFGNFPIMGWARDRKLALSNKNTYRNRPGYFLPVEVGPDEDHRPFYKRRRAAFIQPRTLERIRQCQRPPIP